MISKQVILLALHGDWPNFNIKMYKTEQKIESNVLYAADGAMNVSHNKIS